MMLDHFLQGLTLLPVIHDLFDGERHVVEACARTLLMQDYEPIAVAVWQGLEEDSVDYAEDCGVGSYAQSESQYRDDGESRILSKHAQSVANVSPERIHE